jgi:hypothetical protein
MRGYSMNSELYRLMNHLRQDGDDIGRMLFRLRSADLCIYLVMCSAKARFAL